MGECRAQKLYKDSRNDEKVGVEGACTYIESSRLERVNVDVGDDLNKGVKIEEWCKKP